MASKGGAGLLVWLVVSGCRSSPIERRTEAVTRCPIITLAAGVAGPASVAVAAGVLWSTTGSVDPGIWYQPEGGDARRLTGDPAERFVVRDGYVYWSFDGAIRRAALAGGDVELVTDGVVPAAITVDFAHVYLVDQRGSFGRVPREGGDVEEIDPLPEGHGDFVPAMGPAHEDDGPETGSIYWATRRKHGEPHGVLWRAQKPWQEERGPSDGPGGWGLKPSAYAAQAP